MDKIRDIQDLAVAVKRNRSVVATRGGEWKIASTFLGGLQKMVGLGDRRIVAFSLDFITALDDLEATPVRFGGEQPIDFASYLEVAVALSAALANRSSLRAQEARLRLQERMIALQYRLEAANGGLDKANIADEEQLNQLISQAAEWKKQQTAFYGLGLSQDDHLRLDAAIHYPVFIGQLLSDVALRDAFFRWVIRDRVDVPVFIQYPALRERLLKSNLTTRIGRFGGNLARIQIVESNKIVTLPFEGVEVNILDEHRVVTFRGNYNMTIREAFDIFAAKLQRVGDLEFLSSGINNWNAHLLGWWDADSQQHHQIDITRSAWWKELPILERLSLEETQVRYGSHLDGHQWTLAVNATRTTRTLNPDASHAFVEMVVPMVDGDYAVYAMGKFATTYAGSLFDSMKLFTATLPGTVAYPDENIFYTHREHVRRIYPMSSGEGMAFMESIRKDIVKARNGVLTYQIESENCAKWIQDKLEELFGTERVGNMFRIAMLDTEPPGAAAGLFAMLRLLPRNLHSPVLSVLHYVIGAWRGIWVEEDGQKTWVSITTTQFWQDKVCYVPAVIHHEQQQAATVTATADVADTVADQLILAKRIA